MADLTREQIARLVADATPGPLLDVLHTARMTHYFGPFDMRHPGQPPACVECGAVASGYSNGRPRAHKHADGCAAWSQELAYETHRANADENVRALATTALAALTRAEAAEAEVGRLRDGIKRAYDLLMRDDNVENMTMEEIVRFLLDGSTP